jgi:hypothetical protein
MPALVAAQARSALGDRRARRVDLRGVLGATGRGMKPIDTNAQLARALAGDIAVAVLLVVFLCLTGVLN